MSKKILTVDDDEEIRLTLKTMLEFEGFESVWAKNGQVALDYLMAIPDACDEWKGFLSAKSRAASLGPYPCGYDDCQWESCECYGSLSY